MTMNFAYAAMILVFIVINTVVVGKEFFSSKEKNLINRYLSTDYFHQLRVKELANERENIFHQMLVSAQVASHQEMKAKHRSVWKEFEKAEEKKSASKLIQRFLTK